VFTSLFEPWRGVALLVVNFLALLELAREGLIEVTQAEAYAPIYVRLAGDGGDSSAVAPQDSILTDR
jgi:segregation and condensation protein A